MKGGQTKNAALTTTLAFHYQVLIGLEQCFVMQEGQSVWFEKDGDVSLIGESARESKQTEVKDYANALTDNHENLWKTLKNWVASEFKHEDYGALVLHTTQEFGANTSLKEWNKKNAEERFKTLKEIVNKRTKKELTAKKPKRIVTLQKLVMGTDEKQLKEVLAKIVLFTETDDEEAITSKIYNRLDGFIPKMNQPSFIEALIGFVYKKADQEKWEITKKDFDSKREELTSIYCPRPFTIPTFSLRDATEEELETHEDALFVKKINNIEYSEVIPEALGNWIELHNSLNEELDGTPQFHATAKRYKQQLIRRFKRKYTTAKRKSGNTILKSQDLYDKVIDEQPFGIKGYQNPDFVFKNGLIHDAMDDDERDIKWRIEDE
ncbi:adenylate cyclase [Fodinibius halophilus]|uniref:Adenylate cyclase n=1 Tax=Fodinibius halophilus TaxID=1736908 RepID=A0A6M1SVQ7_9BACT|nr:adenylate cyclase [Fodinibius halophilus]NGP88018.1 adenylate cyclase [Fodinibius halophilus]